MALQKPEENMNLRISSQFLMNNYLVQKKHALDWYKLVSFLAILAHRMKNES